MRAVFPMYDTPFQFMVLRESGLLSVADLAGKRVGIGPSGGTTGIYMPDFFKVLKIDAALRTGSWSELAAAIEARALDALAVGAGVPFPEFAGLEKRHKVRYLPLTAGQVVALRLAIPELGASVVPAGSYPSLTRHYQTVGLYNFAVARSSLPDDLVYAIAEAVFSGQRRADAGEPRRRRDCARQLHPQHLAAVPPGRDALVRQQGDGGDAVRGLTWGCTAHSVRAADQPQDRQSARSFSAADATRRRRRGDRIGVAASAFLLRCICRFLALPGRADHRRICPFIGVKRSCRLRA